MIITHEIVKGDDKNRKYCAKIVNCAQQLQKFAIIAKNWQISQPLRENCTARTEKQQHIKNK